ncbi:Thiol-disulfide oxidoreductase ResA [compost metagenome]
MDIVSASKVTLIDFWASWCKPCRAEIPFLKSAYTKYRSKGFNIISIAVRDRKADWKKALNEEGTAWVNGIEQDGEVWKMFDFQSIPAYALVDGQGKIIAFQWNAGYTIGGNIRQEHLDKKLAEILK